MQFLLLIHGDESVEVQLTLASLEPMRAEFGRDNAELPMAGALDGAEPLAPSAAAMRVRVVDGHPKVDPGAVTASALQAEVRPVAFATA